jgi:hypothetical protein
MSMQVHSVCVIYKAFFVYIFLINISKHLTQKTEITRTLSLFTRIYDKAKTMHTLI